MNPWQSCPSCPGHQKPSQDRLPPTRTIFSLRARSHPPSCPLSLESTLQSPASLHHSHWSHWCPHCRQGAVWSLSTRAPQRQGQAQCPSPHGTIRPSGAAAVVWVFPQEAPFFHLLSLKSSAALLTWLPICIAAPCVPTLLASISISAFGHSSPAVSDACLRVLLLGCCLSPAAGCPATGCSGTPTELQNCNSVPWFESLLVISCFLYPTP